MRISLVTPLYKSADYIHELYQRSVENLKKISDDYEIVFVNDGSPDQSFEIASDLARQDDRVVVIDLSRNFGQHPALMTGLNAATGDYIYICDSDLEEEPEWIPQFFQTMQTTDCDVVYGVQSVKKGRWWYRFSRRFFYVSLNLLSGVKFPADVTTARLMTRRYVEAVLEYKERALFAAGIWHMAGFKQTPFKVAKYDKSETTFSITKLAGLFINAVTAFSTRPLKAVSLVGLLVSALAVIFIIYLIYQKLFLGAALEGWTSVMATILLLGGIILLFNGVMAIYLASIFIEVKQRPLATVREVINPVVPAPPKRDVTVVGDKRSEQIPEYKGIIDHYERCLAEHGDGAKAVDWKNQASATIRYDVMLGVLDRESEAVTLLDFGCGLGDLNKHIDTQSDHAIEYTGLDISPKFVESAQTKNPNTNFLCLDVLSEDAELPEFDYIVMNGIFTRRENLSHREMLAYFKRLLGVLFPYAKRGIAFNVMSPWVDWKSDNLFYPEIHEILDLIANSFSRHIVVKNDYGLYETTFYVYQQEQSDQMPLKNRKTNDK